MQRISMTTRGPRGCRSSGRQRTSIPLGRAQHARARTRVRTAGTGSASSVREEYAALDQPPRAAAPAWRSMWRPCRASGLRSGGRGGRARASSRPAPAGGARLEGACAGRAARVHAEDGERLEASLSPAPPVAVRRRASQQPAACLAQLQRSSSRATASTPCAGRPSTSARRRSRRAGPRRGRFRLAGGQAPTRGALSSSISETDEPRQTRPGRRVNSARCALSDWASRRRRRRAAISRPCPRGTGVQRGGRPSPLGQGDDAQGGRRRAGRRRGSSRRGRRRA